MAEFPAMPLFTDAYLGDTTHLTTIEHGAYLLLLIVAWRSRGCRLPNDDKLLARYAKMTAGQWRRTRPILEPFFTITDDGWTQGRLTDEADHVRQVRESQRANGRASALKRKGRHSTTVQPSVDEASTPTPTPSPHVLEDKPLTPPRQRGARLTPDWQPVRPYPPAVQGMVDQWPEGREARELDGFRDYWTGRARDAAKLDWDKTWHNRIRDQHDRIVREAGYANGRGSGGGAGRADGFTNAIRESRARREAGQRSADDDGGVPLLGGLGGDAGR